jgi:site-specific DNA-methyltransferase (adenine-specific)
MTPTNTTKTALPFHPDFNFLKGDALAQLRTLDAESVHATICDPPYGLSSSLDVAEMLQSWLDGDGFVNDAKGYAGTTWDNSVPGPDLWREVYRTLVPGGYLLAFAGARTAHLTAMAIHLAGFEIRDQISWVYAAGRQATTDLGRAARREGDVDLAKHQAGLRTTLKPGHEPIVVARKPFDYPGVTTAENLLDYGVGAINHDAITGRVGGLATNVWSIHDTDCTQNECLCHLAKYEMHAHATQLYPSDVLGHGGLNVKKPPKSERPVGPDGTTHETVKPLALMRRLIEAVTQPGQCVLDPFLGSGTTAEAALLCGRRIVGCELDERYWPLIESRIKRVSPA